MYVTYIRFLCWQLHVCCVLGLYVLQTISLTGCLSPHNELQYALSLGEHMCGTGELCVETNPGEVACIDTNGKVACMDGRYVHWVTGYEGTRFSLIWYQTEGIGNPRTKALWL